MQGRTKEKTKDRKDERVRAARALVQERQKDKRKTMTRETDELKEEKNGE